MAVIGEPQSCFQLCGPAKKVKSRWESQKMSVYERFKLSGSKDRSMVAVVSSVLRSSCA